jgi:hypothetical protein
MFVTWEEGDDKARALAMHQAAKALRRAEPILRTQGSNIFQNIAPQGVSIRDGFNRGDYELLRPGENLPYKPKDILHVGLQPHRHRTQCH